GIRSALRRMRNAWRQIEHLAGPDRDIADATLFLDLQHHLAFELMEELGTFIPVIIGAHIRAADDHDDEVAIDDALVADRRLEQVAVLVYPVLQVEGRRDHAGITGSIVAVNASRSGPETAPRTAACREVLLIF